jgi:hypothetical protein
MADRNGVDCRCMVVWLFESNLMWSSRLKQSFEGLGHEVSIETDVPERAADVAVVNLGDRNVADVINALRAKNISVIAHAGHKEKELLDLGRGLEVDRLATNSELTFKLPQIIEEIQNKSVRT